MDAIGTLQVRAVSIEEGAQLYGLSKSTLRRVIQRGEIRVKRVGRRVVIRIEELEKWIGK